MKKSDSTARSGAVGGSHAFGPVNCMIFEAPRRYLTYVCNPSTVCKEDRPLILDTPNFIDQENMNWPLWEEPPEMVNFQ